MTEHAHDHAPGETCLACQDGPQAALGQIRETISRVGWAVLAVGAGEGSPPFSYTAGLPGHLPGSPELLLVGLPAQIAHMVVHEVVRHLERGGQITPGVALRGMLAGDLRLLPRQVTDTGSLRFARALSPDGDVQAVQLLWPDTQGRLPGEAGCTAAVQLTQDRPLEV